MGKKNTNKHSNTRIAKLYHQRKENVHMYRFLMPKTIFLDGQHSMMMVFNPLDFSIEKNKHIVTNLIFFTFATGGLSCCLLGTSHGSFQWDIVGISM